jgi:glutamate decarboxylase
MYTTSPKKKNECEFDQEGLMKKFFGPVDSEDKFVLNQCFSALQGEMHSILNKYLGTKNIKTYDEIEQKFTNSRLNEHPVAGVGGTIRELFENIAPYSANVSSPYYAGHMTSAIPYFMIILKAVTAALNQNVVKLETSGVITALERELIGKMHRLVFDKADSFYQEHIQNRNSYLGCITENGTLGYIQALWLARNAFFSQGKEPFCLSKEGIAAGYKKQGIDRCVVLVSKLSHYSLQKVGDILGIGNKNIIKIDVDKHNRMDVMHLETVIHSLNTEQKTKILAIVATAGTTECGSIDPLVSIGRTCKEYDIHFHVDAAWGGPTLMSDRYKHLMDGIQQADSVSMDGHKQLYMPMTCGLVFFNKPRLGNAVIYHANYINRPESVDLGIRTISGSREANSLVLASALKILGTKGYAFLIERGIETAKQFAELIKKRSNFELVSEPELNIINYRLFPSNIKILCDFNDPQNKRHNNTLLNEINIAVQRQQKKIGKSFVSRTLMEIDNDPQNTIVVLRCVIMNPMTTINVLQDILNEQEEIYQSISK